MNTKKNGLLRREIQLAVILMIVFSLMNSCGRTKTGTLIGVSATFGLDEAMKGKLENIEYGGTVIVELDDGTEVDAVCDKELWSKLRGGQKLKIAPTDSEAWKVIEIVKEEKPKDDNEDKTVIVTGRLVKEDGSPVSNASISLLVIKDANAEKEKIEYADQEGKTLRRIVRGYLVMVSHSDIEGGMVIKDGKILTSTDRIEKDDKGQFRLEVVPENFPEGTEFMLSAQLSPGAYPPKSEVPLFDGDGNLIRFDSTMLIGSLKVGDVTSK